METPKAKWWWPAIMAAFLIDCGLGTTTPSGIRTNIRKVDLKYSAPLIPKCLECITDGPNINLVFGENIKNKIVKTTMPGGNTYDTVYPGSKNNFNLSWENNSATLLGVFSHKPIFVYGAYKLSNIENKLYHNVGAGIGLKAGNPKLSVLMRVGMSKINYVLSFEDSVYVTYEDTSWNRNTAVSEKGIDRGALDLFQFGVSVDKLILNRVYLNFNIDVLNYPNQLNTNTGAYGVPLGIKHRIIPVSLFVSPKTRSKIHPMFGVEYLLYQGTYSSGSIIQLSVGAEY